MSEINQKLGFDASGAINSLRDLQQMMNGANQSARTFAQSAKKFNDQAKPMVGALDRMGTSAAKVTGLLDRLGISANKAAVGVNKLGNKPQGFAANMQYFDQLSKKVKEAKAAQDQLAKQPPPKPPATDKVVAFGKEWANVARMFKSMIIVAVLRRISNELLGAIESARKFGLAIAEIQTIGQGLGLTNDQLSSKIIGLSNALGKSAQDVAEGLYQTISNQVVEAADAFEFLEQAERLAITTHADTAQAVDALSSVMNSYNLSISDATRVSGILFETVNLGRLRLDEIADRIGRIAPMAAQVGVRFEELGAAIATMTVQGVKADTAITQVRAIMSKLIKPTVELQKVFRSWGVKDGPEAIKTFGGLAGVLRKLSRETGGSSAEMSEFFNVVRAMTGVMSLNTDEGKKFAETLDKMDVSASKATVAWKTFIQADAYGLTKSVNELKNSFLQLGQALIPLAQLGADVFNKMFGGVGEGIEFMRMAGNQYKAIAKLTQLQVEKIDRDRRAKEREFTRFNSKEWRDREQVVRENLAKMGQSFNKFIVEMELQQKSSTNVFKSFTDDMVSNWDDAFKQIADFADNAKGRIKDNVSAMRDIQNQIDDLHYDNAIENAGDGLRKFNLVANQVSSLVQQAITEAMQAGTDPEKFKAAMQTFQRAQKEAQRGLSEARSAGDQAQIKRFSALLEQSLSAQKNEYAQVNAEIEKNIPLAEEAMAKYSEKGKMLKEYTDEYVDSLEREQKATSDTEKKAEQDLRARLKESIQGLDFGPEADIMTKLGLDPASLTRLNWQIKDIFNLKELEWQGAQESLQAALDKMSLKAKVELSPEMKNIQFEELGAKMGITAKPGESPAQQYQRTFDEAKKSVELQKTLGDELDKANAKMQTGTVIADNNYTSLSRAIDEHIDGLIKVAEQEQRVFIHRDRNGKLISRFNKEDLNAKLEMFEKERKGYESVASELAEYYFQVKDGTELTSEQTERFGELTLKLEELGSKVPTNISSGILEMARGVDQMNEALREQKVAEEGLEANKDKATYGDLLLKNIEALGGKMLELQNKINETNTKVGEGVEPWNNQNGAVDDVQGSVLDLNNSVGSLPSTIQAATDAFWAMEEAASAAALAGAMAQSTAGSYAYHGGLMNFLAAGGRGQDQRPAMLAKGEYVVSAGPAAKFFSELNAMNQGSRPVYREQGGSVTNVGDVNVTVKGGDTGQQTVREIGNALRREIKRNNIKLK